MLAWRNLVWGRGSAGKAGKPEASNALPALPAGPPAAVRAAHAPAPPSFQRTHLRLCRSWSGLSRRLPSNPVAGPAVAPEGAEEEAAAGSRTWAKSATAGIIAPLLSSWHLRVCGRAKWAGEQADEPQRAAQMAVYLGSSLQHEASPSVCSCLPRFQASPSIFRCCTEQWALSRAKHPPAAQQLVQLAVQALDGVLLRLHKPRLLGVARLQRDAAAVAGALRRGASLVMLWSGVCRLCAHPPSLLSLPGPPVSPPLGRRCRRQDGPAL